MKATDDFSILQLNLEKKNQQLQLQKLFTPASPWPADECTPAQVRKRRDMAHESFQQFDQLYFPPESYGGQYAPANAFHAFVADSCVQSDRRARLIIGPHDHAKSATVYKALIWAALTGRKHFCGIASETLETPISVISAISQYLHTNERIKHDFPDLDFLSDALERLHITTHLNPRGTVFQAYSESKSTRGKNVGLFFRFDLLVIEDLENRESSLTEDSVNKRLEKLAEFQSSLAESGCLIMTANNFDERCAVNQMLKLHEQGQLDSAWQVFNFPAWSEYYTKAGKFMLRSKLRTATKLQAGPLWPERYPAKTERELRAMLKPFNDSTWKASYQGQPQPPAGDYFARKHLGTFTRLPADLIGVINTDQNLARKGKGDKTALGALAWSFETQQLYAFGIRYKSYSDANDTFDDMRWLLQECITAGVNIISVGMEGHVNQESHWQMHLENYMARNSVLMPPVYFHRYNLELEAKTAQLYWTHGQVLLPQEFTDTDEGTAFINDVLAFTGRKLPGRRDDAPDWLIKSIKMLLELYVIVDNSAPLLSAPRARVRSTSRFGTENRCITRF